MRDFFWEPEDNGTMRDAGISHYRVKEIISGPVTEFEIYPYYKDAGTERRARKRRGGATREAMRRVNQRNAEKDLTRKINANFTPRDLYLTLTYRGVPPDPEEAAKALKNYIRRVKAWRKRNGLNCMKYIHVTEYAAMDPFGKPMRIHHHIIMSAMDRDAAEALWTSGRTRCDYMQPSEKYFEALGTYLSKDPKGRKRWGYSQGLKKPKVIPRKSRMTKRKADILARDYEGARAILAKQRPDLTLLEIEARFSPYVPGAYITVKMRKGESFESVHRRENGRGRWLQREVQGGGAYAAGQGPHPHAQRGAAGGI